MKRPVIAILSLLLFALCSYAQKLPKPTLLGSAPNATQQEQIRKASELHDNKKFDEAIAIYDKLLAEAPDLTLALYEKSFSLYAKGEKEKAMQLAYEGAKYKSDELPMMYMMIANGLDDAGKDDEAVRIYRQAEDILKMDVNTQRYLAAIYYNLGVTYLRQKKDKEARVELKKAVENDFAYASPHVMLANIFSRTRYRIPAFLAAGRFLSIEVNTDRSGTAAAIIRDVFRAPAKDAKSGNITINLDLSAPTDEGDFGMYDLLVGVSGAAGKEDKKKSDNDIFVDGIDSMISMLADDKKLAGTFVGKTYIPFYAEMKRKGYTEVFGHVVLYISGTETAKAWLESHDAKLGEFLAWAKNYRPAK